MTLHPLLNNIYNDVKSLSIGGLSGSSKAYLIALLQQERSHPCLIITPSQKEAEEFYEDLTCFQRLGVLPTAQEQISLYSQWNVAPYEHASPHREIVSERLTILEKLADKQDLIVVAPVDALMQRTLPRRALNEFTILLGVGEELDRAVLTTALIDTGYKHTHLVENRGEFSVRGGIVDIFPSLSQNPIRLEFFGDEIEAIREFDPETQRSYQAQEMVFLLPMCEIVLTDSTCAAAKEQIEQHVSEAGASFNALKMLMDHIDQKIFFPGIEWYAPYFHGKLETLFDYLSAETLVFLDEFSEIENACRTFQHTIERNFRQTEERGFLVPSPEKFFLSSDDLINQIQQRQHITLQFLELHNALTLGEKQGDLAHATEPVSRYNVPTRSINWAYTALSHERDVEEKEQHIAATTARLREWLEDGQQIVIASYTEHQAKRLTEILHEHHVPTHLIGEPQPTQQLKELQEKNRSESSEALIIVGTLNCGFIFPLQRLILLNEDELLSKKTVRRRHLQRKPVKSQMTLGELELNDYVVHVDHGIGVYLGLKKITVQRIAMECLHLEYSGGDKLYVPIDRLDLVQKYKGADQRRPKIDKLGGTNWARVKERVKASVEKMAQNLLEIYAARQALPGQQFSIDDHFYREFEASFEYEETPDQAKAIEAVARDMDSPKPMDRLVCGDVGYGKTEVAMRAAFRAVLNGKQVALLVPTTLLAQQHYQTFSVRLAPYPLNIGLLSRFKTRKEQQEIVKGVKEGTIDIVIGTHRLLQSDIDFKDLGLVIIDEEQRFGVSHKEKIRQYRKLVDVLTLTATPIPRTLHMSLMGVRDLSIIETPPEGRLAVRTYVLRFDDDVIYEAINNELQRGGQVFFIHNKVETIDGIALRVSRVVPHARVAVAHGQMKEHELEKIMLRFINKEIDVLVSTTIVESGLDIPSVNTIIINRAHEFGLSQLYQLRGRIGRSKERAHAYLLIPDEKLLSSDAKKRLRVIQELSELGSGFRLATHDLEIRGAGNLLGAEQTGHIAALGFDMYCQIIDQTVKEMQGIPLNEEFYPQIDMQVSAHFPEEYIPDIHQRLEMYKRLMSSKDYSELMDVEEEIQDRYGKLPQEAQNIVLLAELKLLAVQLRIQQIQAVEGPSVKVLFDDSSPVSPEQIRRVIKHPDNQIRHPSARALVVPIKRLKNAEKIEYVRNILQSFQ
ncbi:MAG: transcription-repair coupling factor [Candidatus Vecturithrix sp.]|jgi:transcription-repair coupling factor (superfamily II helicase)|nr:transcription-repair coupling factor [Candidatus Vecturithrix sp.]